MVDAISINPFSYNSVVSGSNKLYVPVNPALVIYSHFEHVSGIAAKPQQHGVSISKIQILNTLIDQLVSMKNKPSLDAKTREIDAEHIDALIDTYQAKIQTSVQMAQATGYGLAGVSPQAGVLFSLDV